jgi:hypothetical protein
MMPRRIFGVKRDKVKIEWRKLHNEELYGVYSSQNIIRVRMRWTGRVKRMGERAYKVLVGEPNGKKPLGRPRRRWEGKIKTCL